MQLAKSDLGSDSAGVEYDDAYDEIAVCSAGQALPATRIESLGVVTGTSPESGYQFVPSGVYSA